MSSNDSAPDTSILQHFQHEQDVGESIYLAIQVIGGHILLPLLVITILLKKTVNKHPVFVNFCVSWIFSSVVYSMLVYRGRSSNYLFSLNPSSDTCLIQASLVNGAQALTTCTSLALVVHLAYVLRLQMKFKYKIYPRVEERVWNIAYNSILLGLPFLAFVTFAVVTLVIGSPEAAYSITEQAFDPDTNLALPAVFFCIIVQNSAALQSLDPGMKLFSATLIFSMIITFITFGLEVFVAILIYRNRFGIKHYLNCAWVELFHRVALFSVYRVVALGLNIALIIQPDEVLLAELSKNNLFNGVINYLQAAIPLVVFITFATQRNHAGHPSSMVLLEAVPMNAVLEEILHRNHSKHLRTGSLSDFEIIT